MQDYTTSFGIGFEAGVRSMTACAALTWAASEGRTRGGFIPASPEARTLATSVAAKSEAKQAAMVLFRIRHADIIESSMVIADKPLRRGYTYHRRDAAWIIGR